MRGMKERELQAQKLEALGQFAGGIAHDFNNILSVVEGYTHIALRQLREGTLTAEQLQKILKSTQRGAGLTRQLLAFGRQKIELDAKIELADALRQQQILLKPLLGETVQLFLTVPEEPVWIGASQDQFSQIVLNLALNARDAMPEGGEMAIMCMRCQKRLVPPDIRKRYPEADFARITVMDSGQGIPPEIMPRIFDPFFSTKDQGKGTGLGLSVVHGVVEQLKGGVHVDSKVGEGSSFEVYLPIVAPPADQKIVLDWREQPVELAGKTILLAEDEPELRDVLGIMLSDMKMKVLTAQNGNDALMVQDEYSGRIDFLLTDVVMPEMDGARLGELFTSLRPETNVVYMSGYPFMDGRKDIALPEDADFISKPLQEDKIRRILQRALERGSERAKE